MRGPLTSIEISGIGERVGSRIPVTVAASGREILLPASVVQFEHRRVILPVWLRDKLVQYLKPSKKAYKPMGRSEIAS